MCDSTQGSLYPSPMKICQNVWIQRPESSLFLITGESFKYASGLHFRRLECAILGGFFCWFHLSFFFFSDLQLFFFHTCSVQKCRIFPNFSLSHRYSDLHQRPSNIACISRVWRSLVCNLWIMCHQKVHFKKLQPISLCFTVKLLQRMTVSANLQWDAVIFLHSFLSNIVFFTV